MDKTGTSKVVAMSKAQKAQNIFLENNLNFSKNFFSRKMSHSAEIVKEGTLFDFQTCILLQNNKKLKRGPFGNIYKFSKKESHSAEKKFERGDSLVPSGFVGYLEKVKNERGTLCTKFALALLPDWAP